MNGVSSTFEKRWLKSDINQWLKLERIDNPVFEEVFILLSQILKEENLSSK